MGFFLNPGTRPALDDTQEEVANLQDFTAYRADLRRAQRERRNVDPHVDCEPPPTLLHAEQPACIVANLHGFDDSFDFYQTDKYVHVLQLIGQLAHTTVS